MLVNGKPCSRTLSAFVMWHFWGASSGCVRQQGLQTPECGLRCQWNRMLGEERLLRHRWEGWCGGKTE
ncbi:hypothetical protein OEZ86_009023 [Tetradesmus obliquus]|uniref:Uncharacterized protein n=1 Tax=Tetradesmus obliquus TaxID=3088 RepID=A0A383VMD7_TETOB|nr:hypothetical protein OEZ86_009023 [Tetradesmus obliquus]|eukprot:jgi/Sobl393_1/11858/SZX66341.1